MLRRDFLLFAASAAAVPLAARAAPAPAGRRPVADFAALPFFADPALSPDGTQVAAKVASGGEQFLAILPLLGDARPRLIASRESDLNWWSWVNDEWLIAGIGGPDKAAGVEFYVRRVIGIHASGQKIVPLAFRDAAEGADDVIWIARDGTPRIRLALQKSIYLNDEGFWPEVIEIDVTTGRSERIVPPREGVTQWYADGTGTVRIGIGFAQNGRSSLLLHRRTDDESFRIVDRANSRKDQKLLVPILFLDQPGQALAIDDRDGFDALYRLDLETMTLGERVFGVDGIDIGGIVADEKASRVLGVTYTDKAARIHWLDPELADLQAKVDAAVQGRRATVVSMSRNRQRLLYHLGGGDRPGAYYFMDVADGRLQRLANVNERIGAAKLHPIQTIAYKARDGLDIQAVLTLPAGVDAKALPLVVMPHGGPFTRDSEEWDWWSQFLADRGYAVVQPNYRGSSGFGTEFAEKGKGQWGLAMQDDLNDAVAHLARQGIADPKRVAIVGGSYGGYAALRAAQRDGALYRCAVSFAGVSDLPALLRYDSRFLNSGRGRDWLKEQAPDLKGVSPINFASQVSIPVLLVHGKKDRRVPARQSREMAEKLAKAGKDVRYVEQPLGDHHFSRLADRVQFLEELEAFLAKHNPA